MSKPTKKKFRLTVMHSPTSISIDSNLFVEIEKVRKKCKPVMNRSTFFEYLLRHGLEYLKEAKPDETTKSKR